MREMKYLVLLALLFISVEARPRDQVGELPPGLQPVSLHPALSAAASNGTEIKTPKTPSRHVAEGYGKRSIADEGQEEEEGDEEGAGLGSEVQVGPSRGDAVVKERKEEDQPEETQEEEQNARNEERETEGEVIETAGETETKISFFRDRRSAQNAGSASDVDNDKSSEEDARENATVLIPIARPQRPGLFRVPEGGAAENEKKPVIAGKESSDVTTDADEDATYSRSERSPQRKDGACEDDDDDGDRNSEDATTDDAISAIPIARPHTPGFTPGSAPGSRRDPPAGGSPRNEETSDTEGEERSEKESTDETTDSTEETSSSRSKRHPQSRDDPSGVDNDKSSEEDTHEGTPVITPSAIGSPQRPLLRRPAEVTVEETRLTAGNDNQEGKEDKEPDEDATASAEETNARNSSRNRRSPQKNDGGDKSSKDTKDETTAAPTSSGTPRPIPRRTTERGSVTGKPVGHSRPTTTPTSTNRPTHAPTSKRPTHAPTSKRPTLPAHTTPAH